MKDDKNPELISKISITCCTNFREKGGSCSKKNCKPLIEYLRQRCADKDNVEINTSGCMLKCKYGPTMMINSNELFYTYKSEEDIDEIIDSYIKNGMVVERLLIK